MNEPAIVLEKAHDIRRLKRCSKCGKIGDAWILCARRNRRPGPPEEYGKLSLGEIPKNDAIDVLC